MSNEDARQAASLAVTLSGSLTAGAVAIIGAVAAACFFLADKYEVFWAFYPVALLGVGLLAWGIYEGGQAAGAICREGAKGTWNYPPDEGSFNSQAIGALFGTIVLLVALAIGLASPRRSAESAADRQLQERVQALDTRNAELTARLRQTEERQRHIRAQLRRLDRR